MNSRSHEPQTTLTFYHVTTWNIAQANIGIPCTMCGGVLNVGGHSEASRIPNLINNHKNRGTILKFRSTTLDFVLSCTCIVFLWFWLPSARSRAGVEKSSATAKRVCDLHNQLTQ